MEIFKLRMNVLTAFIENRHLVVLYLLLLWSLYKNIGGLLWVFIGLGLIVFSSVLIWVKHNNKNANNSSIRIYEDFIAIGDHLGSPERIELNQIKSFKDEYKYLSLLTSDGKKYDIYKAEYKVLDIYKVYEFLLKSGANCLTN